MGKRLDRRFDPWTEAAGIVAARMRREARRLRLKAVDKKNFAVRMADYAKQKSKLIKGEQRGPK